MIERWLPVVGFEGLYCVSDLGRIRSERRFRVSGRILTPSAAGKGYRKVTLCRRHEKYIHRYVHKIVLEAFVGQQPAGMEAAHNNGQRDDNRLINLRWDTRAGNFADKIIHGTACEGERHGRRKLNAADVLAIRSSSGTLREIGDLFGVGPMQIHRIKTRENWGSLT